MPSAGRPVSYTHLLTREFELNRPHAPEIYVEVASVNRSPCGTLTFATGDPVEPILVMKRFDQKNLLARVAEKEPLTRQTARDLALMVADYHRALTPLPDRKGAEIMREIAGQLAEELKDAAPPGREPLMTECADLLCKEVERIAGLLDARAEAGYIRRCHGDLHLRNIVFLDGKPTPFDALEFNEAVSYTHLHGWRQARGADWQIPPELCRRHHPLSCFQPYSSAERAKRSVKPSTLAGWKGTGKDVFT